MKTTASLGKWALGLALAFVAVPVGIAQVGGGVYAPRDTLATIAGTLPANKGGTGVANNAAATLTRSGNHALTITTTGTTNVTLPTSGTLATLGANTFTGVQTINLNAAALQAPVTGSIAHIGQANSTVSTFTHDGYAGTPIYAFRRADGTAASPSGVPAGGSIAIISGYGYGANAYSAAGRANVVFTSAESGTWTNSAQGANIIFQTTAIGTTTTAEALRVTAAGVTTPNHYRSTAPNTQTGATYTVLDTDNYIIANGAGTLTLTLPAAATYTGRALTVKTTVAQTVVSASSNVVPRAGGAAGTAILAAAAGNWATLVSNGTSWVNMAGTP